MAEYFKYDVVFGELAEEKNGNIQSGYRPCIVIQNNIGNKYSPTLLVLPLTKSLKNLNQPTHIVIEPDKNNGLRERSMVLAEQTRTINKNKVKKIGRIADRDLQKSIFRCFVYAAAYGEDDKDLKEIKFA